MKKLIALSALTFASTLFAADVAYSPPVGGFTTTAAANTDTLVSPTLAREAAWRGTIAGGNGTNITASSDVWSAGQFAPGAETYYIRMLSGALSGQYFVITGNTASALTVDAAGLNLSTLVSGDSAEIVPFWTLGTLYPASQAGTAFIASPSGLNIQTQLLFYDSSTVGSNRAPTSTFYFFNGAWRKLGSSASTSFNNTIIYPDTYFIQRNRSASTSLIYVGRVQPGALGTIIEGGQAQNDNYVALSFPVDITLDQSGIATSGFVASPSGLSIRDQLLVYSTTETGTNRAPTSVYYYFNGAWRKFGSAASINFGGDKLTAGSGFIIRKVPNGSSSTWIYNTGL